MPVLLILILGRSVGFRNLASLRRFCFLEGNFGPGFGFEKGPGTSNEKSQMHEGGCVV